MTALWLSLRGPCDVAEIRTMSNVLMLNYEFPPVGGGGGVASYELARGFVTLGCTVYVVTSRFGDLPFYECFERRIHVYRVNVLGRKHRDTASLISMATYLLSARKKIRSLCRRLNFDVINTHFAVPTGPIGNYARKHCGAPNVLSIHGGDIFDPSKRLSPHRYWFTRWLVRGILRRASAVVAQSRNTRDNAYRFYRSSSDIAVIPLPFTPPDHERESESQTPADSDVRYVIAVGRLVRRKAFDDFIKVIARLPLSVHGIILGDGPERQNLRDLAISLGVSGRIHMPGYVSDSEKRAYLRASEVFLLSSLHEGFGIVVQEAFAEALPVVATNHGGQRDLIEDGVTGFLTDVHDVESMARCITTLINDESLRQRVANEGYGRLSSYSPVRIASKYLDLVRPSEISPNKQHTRAHQR